MSTRLSTDVSAAIARLDAFTAGGMPRTRLLQLERLIAGVDRDEVEAVLIHEMIDDDVLRAALVLKRIAGEVNVLIHATGILLTLHHILEPNERVLYASLGAGTGGRRYDLETDHRIAEFKFTNWRGNDSVRQRELFADFVNLAEASDERRRQLFVTGAALPRRFLTGSKRSLASVCERRRDVLDRITTAHGNAFATVSDYVLACKDRVEIVDLADVLPAYLVQEVQAVGAQ